MDDALTESKQRFAQFLVRSRQRDFRPLAADQWVTISLLQKSIRRGEVETAQRAAFTGPSYETQPRLPGSALEKFYEPSIHLLPLAICVRINGSMLHDSAMRPIALQFRALN